METDALSQRAGNQYADFYSTADSQPSCSFCTTSFRGVNIDWAKINYVLNIAHRYPANEVQQAILFYCEDAKLHDSLDQKDKNPVIIDAEKNTSKSSPGDGDLTSSIIETYTIQRNKVVVRGKLIVPISSK
eukprot:TRINITY_DN10888_c0_g1_i2.p1 TRINITY_DN10888_c0_g1~~TRINITY_DN10888_c0_g1_i2.p1  ORF type:complete len:131 (+),score=32.81 TRINITY_DN10888_c0_g1_i2:205-597(+)